MSGDSGNGDVGARVAAAALQREESPERAFDVVLFGATGFTGALTAVYLAKRAAAAAAGGSGSGGGAQATTTPPPGQRPFRWAIAGRSLAKLNAVKGVPASVPRIVADSADRESLDALARQTKVVATTVGPYTQYGSGLVAACVAHATHYCDLTGEVLWARDMILQHHEAAAAARCKIVFHCGFDCIPVDLGTLMASSLLPGGPATRVSVLATVLNGGPSGGTLASGKLIAKAFKAEQAAGLPDDPYVMATDIVGAAAPGSGLPPHPLRVDGPGTAGGQTGVRWSADFGTLALPNMMAFIDCRVVRRSLCLRGEATSYEEAMSVGGSLRMGAFVATHLPSFWGATSAKPGEGPSESIQRDGRFEFEVLAENSRTGEHARVRVKGAGDPGYAATAVMLAESALCLALDEDRTDVDGRPLLPRRYGCLTPSTAMGMQLARRLEGTGRFSFQREQLTVAARL